MRLDALQAHLQSRILDGPDDRGDVLGIAAGGSGLSRERRLAIYRNAYRMRLEEALQSVFERTWAYVGDDEFAAAAARYVEAHPSTSRNLRDYGADFPASLSLAMPADPEVAELATMDWNLHRAFDAPDCTPLVPADLSGLDVDDWAEARLVFHPGVSMAVFAWNVARLWHALDEGVAPPQPTRLERPAGHLFWRGGLASRFRSVDDAEYGALRDLAAGAPFAAICARATPEQAGTWLRTWMQDELLAGVVAPRLAATRMRPQP